MLRSSQHGLDESGGELELETRKGSVCVLRKH
jgi:hypothetical protein